MKLPPVTVRELRVTLISEADLFLLAPPTDAEVTHWNSSKVEAMTLHSEPAMETEPPAQASTDAGKPEPETVTVVPPPRLPSDGLLLKICMVIVWVRGPPVARPRLFTTTEMS